MIASLITATAALYLFAALFALAPRKSGYSHFKHTISEIGESGAPDQRFVAVSLFLPIGLLLFLVAYLVRPSSPVVATLALCIAIGYLGAAAFSCDPGLPPSGTARQALHNLAGGVEYLGGGSALVILAEDFGQPFRILGLFVLGTAITLSLLPSNSIRGIIQRIAEACLFGGLALATWRIGAAV